MKKILAALFAVFTIMFIAFASDPDTDNRRYVEASGGLVLRDAPSTSGNKITLIPDGEELMLIEEDKAEVTISGKKGKWSKVTWKDKTGWVFGGFLLTVKEIIKRDAPPLSEILIGMTFSFDPGENESKDQIEITINQDKTFEGYCFLNGSGKAEFKGKYTFKDTADSVTFTMNGKLSAVKYGMEEEHYQKKITNSRFTITKKENDVMYGTIDIPECLPVSDREIYRR